MATKPKSFLDIRNILLPHKVKVKSTKKLAKGEIPTISDLKFKTLDSHKNKTVKFEKQLYKITRRDKLNSVEFELFNLKFNNIEITCPFKTK